MLIALLAVLGVDLIVVVVLLAAVVGRRRWVSHQAGALRGIIRVVGGQVPHLGRKGRRGYGRWVRDVLVWTHAPFFLRNALAPIDAVEGTTNPTGRVRRLGDNPRVVTLTTGGAHLGITVRAAGGQCPGTGHRQLQGAAERRHHHPRAEYDKLRAKALA